MEQKCSRCGKPIWDEQQLCFESPINMGENKKVLRRNEQSDKKPLCLDCETEIEIKEYEMQLEM